MQVTAFRIIYGRPIHHLFPSHFHLANEICVLEFYKSLFAVCFLNSVTMLFCPIKPYLSSTITIIQKSLCVEISQIVLSMVFFLPCAIQLYPPNKVHYFCPGLIFFFIAHHSLVDTKYSGSTKIVRVDLPGLLSVFILLRGFLLPHSPCPGLTANWFLHSLLHLPAKWTVHSTAFVGNLQVETHSDGLTS